MYSMIKCSKLLKYIENGMIVGRRCVKGWDEAVMFGIQLRYLIIQATACDYITQIWLHSNGP